MKTDQAQEADTLPRELKLTARLGGPLALGELGWMSTYIVDALMIGRLPHSALSISASSLGNTIFYTLVFSAIYLMDGVEVMVSQAFGRGAFGECTRTLVQSLWMVLITTPLVMLATLGAVPLLSHFGTPPEIVAETNRYMHALVWSTAPLLLYMALRRYLQGMSRAVLIMVSLLTASAVNFVGDWAFLYGHLGAHAMGIAGSGWATCIVRVYMAGLLLVAALMKSGTLRRTFHLSMLRPDFARLRVLLRIGWPAGLESYTDMGVSTVMSVMCARLGTTLLAAHQVVLDLDAFVYMVPLGIGMATMTRVGQSAGRNSLRGVRRSAKAGLVLGMSFIALAALCFASFPHRWASLYTNDPAVVAAAAPIFLICGFLQLGDAASAIFQMSLVGLGDTRTPLIVYTVWYWILGMPLSYWLTFDDGMGLRGLWMGRAVAAIGSAVTMGMMWQRRVQPASDAGSVRSLSIFMPVPAK